MEISASHVGMVVDPAGYGEIACALAKFQRVDARRTRRRRSAVAGKRRAA